MIKYFLFAKIANSASDNQRSRDFVKKKLPGSENKVVI